MKTLRVVQITDSHLLSGEGRDFYGVDTFASLDRVLTQFKALSPVPELLIVSGDLAEEGDIATYQSLARQLEQLGLPTYIMAGNHDNMQNMSVMTECANIHCRPSLELQGWGFLFINTQVVTQSHGQVGADQLAMIDNYLHSNRNKPVLMAMHHPSFDVCPNKGCQLQDSDDLHRLLERHQNLKIVVAGHTHNDEENLSKPYAQYTTPSTFSFVHHDQHSAKHLAGDFWAAHRLDPLKTGLRVLDLHEDGSFNTRVVWV